MVAVGMVLVGFQGEAENRFNWAWYYWDGNRSAREGKRERDTKEGDAVDRWTTGLYR